MAILISVLRQSCEERPTPWKMRAIVVSRVAWVALIGGLCLFAAFVLSSAMGFAIGFGGALFGLGFLALAGGKHWHVRIHKPGGRVRYARSIADRMSRKCLDLLFP
jgi:hypothetical protein